MDKLINIYVKDTKNSIFKDSRRSPAAITEYYCTQESCELRDKGQCINIGFMQKCIHGYVSEKKGPGPRAKSYNKFILDGTSHPLYNVLHYPPKKMAIINVDDVIQYSRKIKTLILIMGWSIVMFCILFWKV